MTDLLLRVNGIQPAFGTEFGLDSPRANEGRAGNPYRQANVSYSLVQRRDGQVVRHSLIDCGMGVVPSLLEFEHTHGVHVVHEVLLTHPHFDHIAQLDWLSTCMLRSGRANQPHPLPINASPECWENGPNRVHYYLAERSDFRQLQPGIAIMLGDLTVTPDAGGTVSGGSASRFLNLGNVQGPSSASNNYLIFNMLFNGSTGQTSGRIGFLGGFATGDSPGVNTQYGATLLGGTGTEFDIGGATPGNSDKRNDAYARFRTTNPQVRRFDLISSSEA